MKIFSVEFLVLIIVLMLCVLACLSSIGCNQKIVYQKEYENRWNPQTQTFEKLLIKNNHFGQTNFLWWFKLEQGSVRLDPNGLSVAAEGLEEKSDAESIKATGEAIGAGIREFLEKY